MDTKRPTVPAAEEILGGYFPVLDHGFVSLVDYMGTDGDVEQAARVSYGAGTRKVSQTRGLIRYLRRHRHTTPSEMVELKFHCAMPMFVARQWIRHRTACLAEGTEVCFDLPEGARHGGGEPHKVRVEEIWDRFHTRPGRHRPDEQRDPCFMSDAVRSMPLRQVDEESLEIQHTRVVDVYRNGRKPVFRMRLQDGKSIEATSDHRFLFADGWSSLRAATGLHEIEGRAVWRAGNHFLYVHDAVESRPAPYQDPVWVKREYRGHPVWADSDGALEVSTLTTLRDDRQRSMASKERDYVERLGVSPAKADWLPGDPITGSRLDRATLVRIEAIEYVGVKETYDLEVEGPYHNFVANGIVTHNSVNELSARYSLMPLLFYTPNAEQFALQSRSNKQGREGGAPADVYREAVERWDALRERAGSTYGWLLEEDVAREIARIDLPVSTYSQWYWKIDLHNLLHFLSLRVDPRAQWEIREFARVIAAMVKRVAPLSYEAWVDYDLESRPLTRVEREVLSRVLAGSEAGVGARDGAVVSTEEMKALGLSAREIVELIEKLQAPGHPDFELDLSGMMSADEMAAKMYEAVPAPFE
jgi:flavin-dependent thymidylate synthase